MLPTAAGGRSRYAPERGEVQSWRTAWRWISSRSTPSACWWSTRCRRRSRGIPGTPMDAAPAAYTLWQRVLRYDPAEPGWINRDRFVLSSGHASMLLYSLIHLAGVKAANRSYEQLGRDAVTLDDIKTFRQAGSRCPGHPGIRLDLGRRDDHRSAGSGCGHQRRHGDRRTMAAGHLQSPGLRSVRLQRLRAVRRRRHDGRRRQRGRLDRRPPAPRPICAGSTTATA